MARVLLLLVFLLGGSIASAQIMTPDTKNATLVTDNVIVNPYDANKPAKAAFYSAILPGLGQAYNKKYWKIPIVLGALGGSLYVYSVNDKEFNQLRDAFRIRLAGGTDDEFSNPDGTPIITTSGLERAQQTAQRNKELSILVTAAIYVLQIIEANVNAHLDQFDVERDLSVNPYMDFNQSTSGYSYGLSLNFTF